MGFDLGLGVSLTVTVVMDLGLVVMVVLWCDMGVMEVWVLI